MGRRGRRGEAVPWKGAAWGGTARRSRRAAQHGRTNLLSSPCKTPTPSARARASCSLNLQ
uniref:Uncharacterized protein n=1 Tax=Setaria italica TaxID=4555 RepID=K4A3K1_SETIT